jgi:C1A family cysteine protease
MRISRGNGGRLWASWGVGLVVGWAVVMAQGAVSAPPDAAKAEPAAEAAEVDLRPVFEKWGLPPRGQGGRGTCSVFTVGAALEYALAEKQQQGTRLSIEFLNWASNEATHQQQDGSYFVDLLKGFQAYGVCPEADMPYRAAFNRELRPSETALERAQQAREAGLRAHWIKDWDPRTGLTEEQFAGVKEALRRKWPVCGGFLWPKEAHWKDGVLEMAPRDGVRDGHSVLLVGFRDDPAQPGGGVFLIRNSSHGPRDGAMSYEYIRTYMNDAVWIGPDSGAESASCAAAAGAADAPGAGESGREAAHAGAQEGPR